jgi:lysophospholipase L1-like esterase
MLLWRDGADDSTKHVDGSSRLTLWDDKSPRGMDGVPIGGFAAPELIPNALAGKSLFKLISQDIFKSSTTPMDEVPGDGYTGPLFEAWAFKVILPATDQANRFLTVAGKTFLAGTDASGGQGRRVTGLPGNADIEEISTVFLNCRQIVAGLDSYSVVILVNSYGPGPAKAFLYFYSPATAETTSYFAQISRVPFVHDLWTGDSLKYFWGYGSANAELYLAEHIIATDAPATVDFNGARDYLIRRWVGTLRRQVVCTGDSLTYGLNLTRIQSYPYKVGLALTERDCINAGLNSAQLADATIAQPGMATLYRPNVQNQVVVWNMTNDIDDETFATPQDAIDAYAALCDLWSASGFSPCAVSVLPRVTFDAAKEAFRVAFNALLAAQWPNFADAFAHVAGNAAFSSPTAYDDPTNYQVDKIHLTAAGQTIAAGIIAAVL